ncbi:MAG: cyclic nucleotide-binding protein [Alphaproteobacteria bacterium]|nr:cyclic nucleotide-binding protein [Alphaproteobacteria bacterium]
MIAIMSELLACLGRLPADAFTIGSGQPLFRRGDPVRHLFTVESGLVHLVRYQEDGTATVMQRAQRGDVVAEASMFGTRYHCDAAAVSDASLRRLSMAHVRAAMDADPGFARACAEHLAHEVHRMRVRSEIMGMKRVAGRLDAWLSMRPLPPRGEWGALAADIGVTREALYRELSRRRRQAAPSIH